MGVIARGMAYGAGFAIANWILGPKPPTVNVTPAPDADQCTHQAITGLLDCINSSENEKVIDKCKVYMDWLVACRTKTNSAATTP